MKSNAYAVVSALVFSLVALLHIVRVLNHWPAQIGQWTIPEWTSWLAILVAGSLAVWGLRVAKSP